jgi:hypothetical protein
VYLSQKTERGFSKRLWLEAGGRSEAVVGKPAAAIAPPKAAAPDLTKGVLRCTIWVSLYPMAAGFATEDGGKMSTLWSDTHPDLERLQVERLRQMPAWRKTALMAEMTQSVRTLALAGLRHRYPTDTPAQLRRRLADLLLGPDLAARAYGPSLEEG